VSDNRKINYTCCGGPLHATGYLLTPVQTLVDCVFIETSNGLAKYSVESDVCELHFQEITEPYSDIPSKYGEYVVVVDSIYHEFIMEVNEYLADGYKPVGFAVTTDTTLAGQQVVTYYQAMYKE